jgi:4-alpha-glucanotransferase
MSRRAAGLIMHPTSLWGPEGTGTLGLEAYRFVEFLARAGQSWWQILPLGPPGPYDSPYMATSAFAGNVQLLDLRTLSSEGWLSAADLEPLQALSSTCVDFAAATPLRRRLLEKAAVAFLRTEPDLSDFRAEHPWLADYVLFCAATLKHGDPWTTWPTPLRDREPEACAEAALELKEATAIEEVLQFWFFQQWQHLRDYAAGCGVRILGDMPIFVAHHSAEVWANRDLFYLDPAGEPNVVAGVPPDYFSATGQRWGNPLYDWDRHRATGFAWWIERLRASDSQVDRVRIDHFRAFESYWEIAATEPTAINGNWVVGPGRELFDALEAALGAVDVVAEDLGIITPAVEALRDDLAIPGMTVLHFAFGGDSDNAYLPHNHRRNQVAYTGTHDNDTTRGWFNGLTDAERHHVRTYLAVDGRDVAWDLVRAAWRSVADLAVAPIQDIFAFDSDRRMNTPGGAAGNWGFRLHDAPPDHLADRLRGLTELYDRVE